MTSARTDVDRPEVGPSRARERATVRATKKARRRARKQSEQRERQLRRVTRAPRAERHFRQTVRRVDLWSVLKISVCFYLCALVVLLAAGAFLWWIASAFGVISSVEDFMGELLEADDFRFLSWRILRGATLIGVVLVCLMVVVTVLAAAFYNLFADILGGVEITVAEEEDPQV